MENKKLKVRVKTWEEMAEEFGEATPQEEINTDFSFMKDMELQLPEDRVIEVELSMKTYTYYWNSGTTTWVLSGQEFAEILEENYEDSADSQVEIAPCVETEKFEIEHSTESLETIKKENGQLLNYLTKQKNSGHIHYIKFQLNFDKDISVRFYHQFDDRSHLKGKWTLKNHKTKLTEEITPETAKMFINDFCEEGYEEIIGLKTNKGYRKIKVGKNSIIKEFE